MRVEVSHDLVIIKYGVSSGWGDKEKYGFQNLSPCCTPFKIYDILSHKRRNMMGEPLDPDSREVTATKNSNLSENGDHYAGHRNREYYGDLLTCRKENSCL